MGRPQSIQSIPESATKAPINLLVYGHPGEGKTPFWGTGGSKVLIMDSDGGIDSARALGSQAHFADVTDYGQLEEIYDWLKNDKDHGFEWVVWDSLTLFQDRTLIDEIMVNAAMENPSQDEDVPAVRHYLKNMNRIARYVRGFAAMPINFGITCHVLTDVDHNGETVTMPLVQGKGMPSKISGYMNVIGYLGKATTDDKKVVQRMLTQKVGRFYARDRFNALGKFVDRPTLPKVEKAIDEKRKEIASAASSETTATPARRRRRTTK